MTLDLPSYAPIRKSGLAANRGWPVMAQGSRDCHHDLGYGLEVW